jgi:hypothetical protein
MNFAKFARTTVMAGLVMAALWGLPQAAQAEEIVAESGNQGGVCHGVTVLAWARVDGVSPSTDSSTGSTTVADDVIVDGRIITAENHDTASSDGDLAAPDAQVQPTAQSDPEYKYVSVRRFLPSTADAAGDDHDILYDPEDDLLPPAKPVGDEEPTPAFDGRLLTAADLTRE